MIEQQTETLWTVEDVAAYLRAKPKWVYELAGRGTLPSLKLGGLLRFNPEDVKRWATSPRRRRVKTKAEKAVTA